MKPARLSARRSVSSSAAAAAAATPARLPVLVRALSQPGQVVFPRGVRGTGPQAHADMREERASSRGDDVDAAIRRMGKRHKIQTDVSSTFSDTNNSSGLDKLSFRYPSAKGHMPEPQERVLEKNMRRIVAAALRPGARQAGVGAKAAALLRRHYSAGLQAEPSVWRNCGSMLGRNALVEATEEFVRESARVGLVEADTALTNDVLMKAYAADTRVEAAVALLERMRGGAQPCLPYHYAQVVACLGRAGNESMAFDVFRAMREDGHPADFTACLSLLRACTSLRRACRVVTMMQALGLDAHSLAVYTCLARVALGCGRYGVCVRVLRAAEADEEAAKMDAIAYELLVHCHTLQAKQAGGEGDREAQRRYLLLVLDVCAEARRAGCVLRVPAYVFLHRSCVALSRPLLTMGCNRRRVQFKRLAAEAEKYL
eukprot:Rhum_TRINITY_DN5439_c0_g1::Rhum_TRINITY_DN5439_c0_g1_i1::g.17446::m.17446